MIKSFLLLITIAMSSTSLIPQESPYPPKKADQTTLETIIQMSSNNFFARPLNEKEAIRGAKILSHLELFSKMNNKIKNNENSLAPLINQEYKTSLLNFSLFELDIRFSNDDGSEITKDQYSNTLRRTESEYNFLTSKIQNLAEQRGEYLKNNSISNESIDAQLEELKRYQTILESEAAYLTMQLNILERYEVVKQSADFPSEFAQTFKQLMIESYKEGFLKSDLFRYIELLKFIDRKGNRLTAKEEPKTE